MRWLSGGRSAGERQQAFDEPLRCLAELGATLRRRAVARGATRRARSKSVARPMAERVRPRVVAAHAPAPVARVRRRALEGRTACRVDAAFAGPDRSRARLGE